MTVAAEHPFLGTRPIKQGGQSQASETPKTDSDSENDESTEKQANGEGLGNPSQAIIETDGWRPLSKGNGRFALALGSGARRQWMPGSEMTFDDLDEERRKKHEQSKQDQERQRQIVRNARGN